MRAIALDAERNVWSGCQASGVGVGVAVGVAVAVAVGVGVGVGNWGSRCTVIVE